MRARELRSSEELLLDDPTAAWVIESGSVALFVVELRGGQPAGPRRFLFACGPGEALFGLPAVREEGRPAVIAVALEDSRLRPTGWDAVAGDGARIALGWVARWRRCLGEIDGPVAEPLEQGAFHTALIGRIHASARRAWQEERERLREREQGSREAAREAIHELASVLAGKAQVRPQGADLFAAAAAAGRAAGVELRRPAAWQEPAGGTDPVEAIARASHVRVRQVVLHADWWRQDCGPLLGFAGPERRPVALLPRSASRYEILDPAAGSRRRVDERVAAQIDPQAYLFYRPLPREGAAGLGLIRFALAGRGADLLLVLSTAAAATLLGMFAPQALALIVDHAIPAADSGLLWQIGCGLIAAALGAALFRWSQGLAMLRMETAADVAAQSAVWDRLLDLQASFFRRFSTGDLESRVSAVSQIRGLLGGVTLRSLFSSVVLLLNLGLLLYYSPALTLVALGSAALACAVTLGSRAMVLRLLRLALELKGRFFGLMVQLLHGVAKLRVAAAEERAFARWARDYASLIRLELRQRRIQDAVQVLNVGVTTLSTVGLLALAAALVGPGGQGLTAGSFLAFSLAYGTFIGAVVNLGNAVTDVLAVTILQERARPILEAVPEVDERRADPGPLGGRIDLDSVVFRYREDGPAILDGVSLAVDPGQFVALVGPSGSGKSTLFRLLLGFETPQSGSILYDGRDLGGLDIHAVRRQMGVVLQNGRINAGSLFENIVTGTRLSLNDAWEAAHDAGFAEEIESMPMGMHTVVSEGGTNLSGGQRQRLLLTRALVHRPRILLLDEATSALDNQTQAVVLASLRALRVTRIVIAHRLSTVRDAGRIHVLDRGRIVEAGSFEELALGQGLFARLIARQLA